MTSHLTRVRGLKRVIENNRHRISFVAPHAGAWIETTWPVQSNLEGFSSRTSRGCVDRPSSSERSLIITFIVILVAFPDV